MLHLEVGGERTGLIDLKTSNNSIEVVELRFGHVKYQNLTLLETCNWPKFQGKRIYTLEVISVSRKADVHQRL